jgi:two-component system chemotaxis response regulator CheB
MAGPISVLIVDDSAFMRKALMNMLSGDPRVTVAGVARNGEEAIQKVAELHPHVVTMDVEMPGMNGLEALRRIMEIRPVPVIMVSSLTMEGASETVKALELGAVDFLPKQLDGIATNIATIQAELIAKVIAAAGSAAKLKRPDSTSVPRPATSALKSSLSSGSIIGTRGNKVVAIGCSTGGPQALLEVLPHLPADFGAGILIVQHMPKFFTKPFADRLNQLCKVEVREAKEGDVVTPGVALIGPAGMHMRVVRRRATQVEIALSSDSEGQAHVPSVDVLMESVAALYGERAVGVLLTGMGHDGALGMKAIKGAKGRTIAQDEATCVVYGMPKAAVDGGHAEKVVGLPMIAGEVANMI